VEHQILAYISHTHTHKRMHELTSNSILSGVVLGANRMPRHSRKKNAVAYRNSMRARWIPIQERAPAPKGWKASFASGDCASGTISLSAIQRCGLKLAGGQLVLRDEVQRHDLRQRVAPDLGVAMQSIRLRVDRDALWDVMTSELGTTLRYHSRQTTWRRTVES